MTITVNRAGSNQAGSRYVLICTITLPTGVTVSDVPSVQWRRPSGGSTTGNVDSGGVSGGKSLYNSLLIFDPLTLSDEGDYTCTATYSLGGHTSPSGMDTLGLSVMSKFLNSIIYMYIHDYNFIFMIIMIIIIIYKILFCSTRAISEFAGERYNRCRNFIWRRHNSYM